MSNEPARLAAYADLVSALLDLRDPAATAAFDQAVDAVRHEGSLTPEQARHLRWLQRETVRQVVEQARAVLPATLVALESRLGHAAGDEAEDGDTVDVPEGQALPPSPSVDLGARRLLVAGLRPLADTPVPQPPEPHTFPPLP